MANTLQQQPKKLFILHANEDQNHLTELLEHLDPLEARGFFKMWHKGKIQYGSNILREVKKELKKADIVLFLMSSDLLNDKMYKYVKEQLLRQPTTNVIPVLLKPVLWKLDNFWKNSPLGLMPIPFNDEFLVEGDKPLSEKNCTMIAGIVLELTSNDSKTSQEIPYTLGQNQAAIHYQKRKHQYLIGVLSLMLITALAWIVIDNYWNQICNSVIAYCGIPPKIDTVYVELPDKPEDKTTSFKVPNSINVSPSHFSFYENIDNRLKCEPTIASTISCNPYVESPFGKAASILKEGDRLEIPHEISRLTNNKTVVAIFKVNELETTKNNKGINYILDKTSGSGYSLYVESKNSDTNICFNVAYKLNEVCKCEDKCKKECKDFEYKSYKVKMKKIIGEWVFVAITRRGNTFQMYVNDESEPSFTIPNDYFPNEYALIVGAGGTPYIGNAKNYNIKADIDELLFFKRTLEKKEINALYQVFEEGLADWKKK